MNNLLTKKELTKINSFCYLHNIKNFTINTDGSIDVDGDVSIRYFDGYGKLPVAFNIVSGNFYAYKLKLTTLEGCPKEVGGFFNIDGNLLTSLEGTPSKIGTNFSCTHNNLTSLDNCPEIINGDFRCSYNNLTSLKGSPKEVRKSFNCTRNSITSLEYGPSIVNLDYTCIGNDLTNLQGAPEIVYNLDIREMSSLTSLEGAPKTILGSFTANECFNLESYKYGPEIIDGSADFVNCGFTTLEYLPKRIDGSFFISEDKFPIEFQNNWSKLTPLQKRIFIKYCIHYEVWQNGVYDNENMSILCEDITDGLQ